MCHVSVPSTVVVRLSRATGITQPSFIHQVALYWPGTGQNCNTMPRALTRFDSENLVP